MRQYGQYVVPGVDAMVNFGVGQPSKDFLPLKLIHKSMSRCCEDTNESVLQYGDIPGYKDFRISLSEYLTKNYNIMSNPDNLFVTNGISQALFMICSLFTKPNQYIVVEEPTYFLAINIFKEFGLNIVSVPMESDGINLKILQEKINEIVTDEPILMYTIPIFHNPTGITLSYQKRLDLIKIIQKYNLFVMADEVYHFLSFDNCEVELKPLRYYSPESNIISMGTFAKILAPSLRLGWIDCNHSIIKTISDCAYLDSNGGLNPFIASIVHNLLDDNSLKTHIDVLRTHLRQRAEVLCKVLDNSDLLIDYRKPDGGYFVWVNLPIDLTQISNLNYLFNKHKVKFHIGNKFSGNGDMKNYVRLCYAYYNSNDIQIGTQRFLDLLKEILPKKYLKNFGIKIGIHGSSGKLGSLIKTEIINSDKYIFIDGINRDSNMDNIIIPDVIIDVSSPDGLFSLINKLKNRKIPLIVGTTGKLDNNLLETYAKEAPILVLSNFSEGVPIYLDILRTYYPKLKEWNFNLEERHHIHKRDSPSGTAKSIQNSLGKKILIESIREGSIIGEHNLKIENDMETLSLCHVAKDRRLFARGSLKYIPWILGKPNGLYNDITPIKFIKYSGSGNTFIIIDDKRFPQDSKYISDFLNNEINADGLIICENDKDNKYDKIWYYYNKDGTMVDMCGNGSRCVGHYVGRNNYEKSKFLIRNGYSNIIQNVIVNNNLVKVSMPNICMEYIDNSKSIYDLVSHLDVSNEDTLHNKLLVTTCGVPHIVLFINMNNDDFNKLDFYKMGFTIMNSLDTKANINFANIIDTNYLNVVTYERGVNNLTGSCGTGSIVSAVLYNNYQKHNQNKITVKVKSGECMSIYLDYEDNNLKSLFLEGNVRLLLDGNLNV